MRGSETDGGAAGVYVHPMVVCVCDVEVACVFVAVTVAVAYEGGFPVVVEFGVGDCYPV